MMKPQYLRAIIGVALIALAGAVAMEAKTRQGEKDYKLGVAAEAKMDWDTAVSMYQKAVDEAPTDLTYQIAMRRARFQGGQKHVEAGVKLRSENKLEEAIQEFRKAIVTDPSSSIAIQELKQTQQMVLDGQASSAQGLTATEKARREEDVRVSSIQGLPQLKPTLQRLPSPMKMNQQMPQILYRTVAQMGGLYVVFDPQYTPAANKPFDVNLDNMTMEEAFDYIAFITHTFWKPISSNTIFVCEDTTAKRRDYEDEVARVFYIPNVSSVQEFQEIANVIRSVVEVRRVATINAGRAMLVRGTADQVALVEKLLHDLDKPKAEVVVDVMIMQANTTRSKQLAATIASGGTAGLNLPITFTPNGTTTTASTTTTGSTTTPVTTTPTTGTTTGTTGSVTLNSLGHISTSSFSTSSLPGALLEAMLTDTKTKVLNSPQVRASDQMKAELQVGLRIPYATGSLGSAVGATTVGVSPLVQTQFQYADTGVTVIISPTVHSADEVTMHVEITVSSVQQYEQLGGGISQPVISQEKNITDVRMRNNEVSLLGGLNQTTDSSTVNGIPGLSSIPVLGKFLFGSQSTEKDSDQIVIAMIPHIVRTPDYSPDNIREIYAGTDQNIKIVHAQIDKPLIVPVVPAPPAGAAPAGAPGTTPATPAPPAAPPPAEAPKATAPQAGTPAAPVAAASAKNEAARLSFVQGPVRAARNETFTLTMQLDGASGAVSFAPLQIKFDPAKLRLDSVSAGDLLTHDGGLATTEKDIRNDAGEASLTFKRSPGAGGVSGSGPLATFTFSAIGKGKGTVSIIEASLKNSESQTLPVLLGSVPVTVQ
ncbi:MAG TPA: cohesin domain-containing protein [Bryobacteraceae bacterium]|jgi:general secretion pathway protein D